MKPILFVIAPKDFRDEELFVTKEELERLGFSTCISSLDATECSGSKGGTIKATIKLADVKSNNYDALVFVGGSGSRIYFDLESAHRLIKEFIQSGKIVAAICIAPMILAKAGILQGKRVSVFNSELETIESLGAHYTGMDVTIDGNIITAYGPQSALRFGRKIAEHLHVLAVADHTSGI
jgi:protease I